MKLFVKTASLARATGLLLLLCWGASPNGWAQSPTPVNVLTWHYDLARSGVNTNETLLTPALVNPSTFGLLFRCPTDGFLYAQPLYLAGVNIPGRGVHNVVFAATENNSVYAFDADDNQGLNATPLWVAHFTDAASGTSAVPISDYGLSDLPATQLGITGTPVIDPVSGTLYVVAHIKDTSTGLVQYYHKLFALDVATGAPKLGGSTVVTATTPGTGAPSSGGQVQFSDFRHLQRCGLVLLNGVVYVTFSSVGDEGPYHGWVLGYDATTLKQVSVFNDTPNGVQGGIWMGGAAPAADDAGNIYFMTGNGTFDGQTNFGDSFVKLSVSSSGLTVDDYFTPSDQAQLAGEDGDLGSGGNVILPDEAGSSLHPHLLLGAGKDGIIYLVDRDNMGHYSPANNNQIVQSVPMPFSSFVTPVYFNHLLYYSPIGASMRAYSMGNASISESPTSESEASFRPGASPCLSANGLDNAILWAIDATYFSSGLPGVLHAYDATDLSNELYNSAAQGQRDQAGVGMKFSTPIVSNGKVYVGDSTGVAIYGVFPPPSITVGAPGQITLHGLVGISCTVQASSDLAQPGNGWQPIASVTLDAPEQTVSDPDAASGGQRFYRTLVGPP